jgi:hypothetical protein
MIKNILILAIISLLILKSMKSNSISDINHEHGLKLIEAEITQVNFNIDLNLVDDTITSSRYNDNDDILNNIDAKLTELLYYKALEFVLNNADNLKYVVNQTDEIILAAVDRNSSSFKHVRNQTDEIILAAIDINPDIFKYVRNQTDKIIMAAIDKNHIIYNFVANKTNIVTEYAINKHIDYIYHAKNLADDFMIEKINQNSLRLEDIESLTLNTYNKIDFEKKKYLSILIHVEYYVHCYYFDNDYSGRILNFHNFKQVSFCKSLIDQINVQKEITAQKYVVLINFIPGFVNTNECVKMDIVCVNYKINYGLSDNYDYAYNLMIVNNNYDYVGHNMYYYSLNLINEYVENTALILL